MAAGAVRGIHSARDDFCLKSRQYANMQAFAALGRRTKPSFAALTSAILCNTAVLQC